MPSLTGGSSSDRDYAPHMWILGPDGNPACEDDYQFVGNLGNVDVTEGHVQYHIGANIDGDLICDAIQQSSNWRVASEFVGNIPIQFLSHEVLWKALDRALDANIASFDRQQLVRSLAGYTGADISTIDFPKTFSFSSFFEKRPTQEQARQQMDEIYLAVDGLRGQLGLSVN